MLKSVFRKSLIASLAAATLSMPCFADEGQEEKKAEEKVIKKKNRIVRVEVSPEGKSTWVEKDGEEEFKMPKLWLGIQLKEVEGDLATHLGSEAGLFVISVMDDSPAEDAGLNAGDIILKAGDAELEAATDILAQISEVDDEEPTIELLVLRDGDTKTVKAALKERPEEFLITEDEQIIEMDLEEIKQDPQLLLKKLGSNKGLRMFAPGQAIWVDRGDGKESVVEGNIDVTIIKSDDEDDGETTVKVTRTNDEPTVIVVKKDGEEKTYSVEELDELPEEIRVFVTPAVKQANVRANAFFHLDEKESAAAAEYARAIAARSQAQAIAAAKELQNEMKSRVRVAQVGRNASKEIEELRALVEELKSELSKLRSQIKESQSDKY